MTAPQQQRIRVAGQVVITANRLLDGRVVYRAADGRWVTELASAAITSIPADAETSLRAARGDSQRIVDPYIAPVANGEDGSWVPANLREWIRRDGPTAGPPLQG
ncbi:MAG TPA: DUF2849 domain-containing protein [Rhizomicrobium sp.]|jgi:hypothetical protein|nr:DUF2849 domain-containing protein [Rhizomicrobium sp.]